MFCHWEHLLVEGSINNFALCKRGRSLAVFFASKAMIFFLCPKNNAVGCFGVVLQDWMAFLKERSCADDISWSYMNPLWLWAGPSMASCALELAHYWQERLNWAWGWTWELPTEVNEKMTLCHSQFLNTSDWLHGHWPLASDPHSWLEYFMEQTEHEITEYS